MLEQLIERMKLEGKITQNEIDGMVEHYKSQQLPSLEAQRIKELEAQLAEEKEKVKEIGVQQNQTNEDLAGLMDFIISGGM